jgi:hypothetical protein
MLNLNTASSVCHCRTHARLQIETAIRGLCPLWVKGGNSHREYMLSTLPPKADLIADVVDRLLCANKRH